jgi:pimeloyl-ACP methyl ester carboxylesterase
VRDGARAARRRTPSAGATAVCRNVTVPVKPRLGLTGQWISGTLCDPGGRRSGILQVLVPGYSYPRGYWDVAARGGRYSYTRHMNGLGYSTFAMDRLGTGRSSHPPSTLVTLNSNADALHDVISAARTGRLAARDFGTVVGVGHSYGSAVVYQEAATYQDTDGIIPSGAVHAIGVPGAADLVLSYLRPARQDAVTRKQLPANDPGYVTSHPGARRHLFDSRAADPAVVAEDERTKTTGTLTELATLPQYEAATLNVRVPVLLAVGRADYVMCAQGGGGALTGCANARTLRCAEAPFFPQAKSLDAYVLPGAGHNLNTAVDAPDWFDAASAWLARRFPR